MSQTLCVESKSVVDTLPLILGHSPTFKTLGYGTRYVDGMTRVAAAQRAAVDRIVEANNMYQGEVLEVGGVGDGVTIATYINEEPKKDVSEIGFKAAMAQCDATEEERQLAAANSKAKPSPATRVILTVRKAGRCARHSI